MKKEHFNTGEKNGMWKGNAVGYQGVHGWVRKRIKKPKWCVRCKKRPAMDLSNISGKYKRELSDWEYLCRKCHMDEDGRNNQLRLSGKSRKLPNQKCNICGKIFHRGKLGSCCSRKCGHISMWKKRVRKKTILCPICNKEFIPKNKTNICCSLHCGVSLSWKKRKKKQK